MTAISALNSGSTLNEDHVTSLQTLSLWIRLQDENFVGWEIIADVHAVLSDTGVPVIPFLNLYFASELTVENQFPKDYHSSQLQTCIDRWKTTIFDPETQGSKLFLRHKLDTTEDGAAESSERAIPTTAIAGTILEDLDHALLGEHDYVIGARDGRVLARQDTQIDHVEAFATIKKRVASFLTFINDTEPTLAPIVQKLHPDFFIPAEEGVASLIGTKYLFVSLYNCVDNLWLMEHRDNLEKSDQNTQEWLASQKFFRGLSLFVQTESAAETNTPLSQLIDETSFLDTFRSREDIKPAFQNQLLGYVMRAYISQNPEILDTLCEVHEKTDQAIDILYGVRDLWMNVPGAIYQAELKELFGSMATEIQRKNKSAIRHVMSQIKEVIGSPQIKELLANQQLPTPLRKQLERPRSDSDSGSSTGSGKVSPALNTNRELQGQFDAMSLELDTTKEQLSIEARKRLESEEQLKKKDDELKRKDNELKKKDAELAHLRAMMSAMQGKK